jgi:hypothetical protein
MDGASQHHQNERCIRLDKLLVIGVAVYLCTLGTHGVPVTHGVPATRGTSLKEKKLTYLYHIFQNKNQAISFLTIIKVQATKITGLLKTRSPLLTPSLLILSLPNHSIKQPLKSCFLVL